MASRTVMVTGGASGIGAAVAKRFQGAGDSVVVFDRDVPDWDVASVRGDVTDPADNRRAVSRAAPGGRLDVLVANAGVHDGGLRLGSDLPLDELAARVRYVTDVNVLGYALALHAAAPALAAADGCAVLTLSDASFDVGGNGAGAAYVAAKHAGAGLVKAAARDLAPVRVNGVAPGGVATGLSVHEPGGGQRRVVTDPDELARRVAGRTLLRRGARLDELADAYYYLASASAGAITGQILRIDGGLLA
jgi:2,3-dihydroxy-2,3-dihydrophenylpropionate dehydrogenase